MTTPYTMNAGPSLDAEPEVILSYIFGIPVSRIPQHCGELSNDVFASTPPPDSIHWRYYSPAADIGEMLAQTIGSPSDAAQHQQPHDLIKLFPFPLHQDAYDTPEDFHFHLMLWLLWIDCWQRMIRVSDSIQDALTAMRLVSEKLIYYFQLGASNRRFKFQDCEHWFDWTQSTQGLFDLESGKICEPHAAILRQMEIDDRRAAARLRVERRTGGVQ